MICSIITHYTFGTNWSVFEQFAAVIPPGLHFPLAGIIYQRLKHMHGILRTLCVVVMLNAIDLDATVGTGK